MLDPGEDTQLGKLLVRVALEGASILRLPKRLASDLVAASTCP